MRTKTIVEGFKNSQKIRFILQSEVAKNLECISPSSNWPIRLLQATLVPQSGTQ